MTSSMLVVLALVFVSTRAVQGQVGIIGDCPAGDQSPPSTFQCPGYKYCLDALLCHNGVYDCPGGEDESPNAPDSFPMCDIYHWQCPGTGICLDPNKRCDGVVDCPNGEDETTDHCFSIMDWSCSFFQDPSTKCPCFDDDSVCMVEGGLCDGRAQCPLGVDEDPAVCAHKANQTAMDELLARTCTKYWDKKARLRPFFDVKILLHRTKLALDNARHVRGQTVSAKQERQKLLDWLKETQDESTKANIGKDAAEWGRMVAGFKQLYQRALGEYRDLLQQFRMAKKALQASKHP